MEIIIQILGMAFVGIIMICIGWTIVEYIFGLSKPKNRLEENIKKYEEKFKTK